MSENKTIITAKEQTQNFKTLRTEALSQIEKTAFPGIKDEDWKYTRIGKLSKKQFTIANPASEVSIDHLVYPQADNRLVFINGFFKKDFSKINSPYIKTTSQLSEGEINNALQQTGYVKEGLFTSYNDAFFTDGVVVNIPKNKELEGLTEIVYISTGKEQATVTKNIFLAGEGSKGHILVQFLNLDGSDNLLNHALHAYVAPNANLNVYKLQNEKPGVSHFSSENIFQQNDSSFSIHTITLNGDLVRNDLNIKVDGSNCETHLGGVFVADGTMHVDNHTMVDHQKPHCMSNELYKGIARDKGTGVFNGKIYVRRDAQKINAYQNSNNILLSDEASVYTKPELEIYADDVKCSHGTTTGYLDDEALFYLQARGIGEDNARALLVQAFAADVINHIENNDLRDWFITRLNQKLNLDK